MKRLDRLSKALPLYDGFNIPAGSAVLVGHSMFQAIKPQASKPQASKSPKDEPILTFGIQWIVVLDKAFGDRQA